MTRAPGVARKPAPPAPFEPSFTCLVPSCALYQVRQYCLPREIWDPQAGPDGTGALVPHPRWSHARWSAQAAACWHWESTHAHQSDAERGQDVPQELLGVLVGAGIQPMYSVVTEEER